MPPVRPTVFHRLVYAMGIPNVQMDQMKDTWEIVVGTSIFIPGSSCSKLTTSLVNDSLKFTSSDTQIC